MENENGNNTAAVPEVENVVITADTPLPKPKCPFCGTDPLIILARTFNIGRFKFLVAFCTTCRNTVPAMLLDVAEPVIQRAAGPIVHP